MYNIQKRSPFSLPKHSTYFKEELFCETLQICPPQKPAQQIINVTAQPNIERYKLIDTKIGRSYENQNLSGVKLIVELSIQEQVRYVADTPSQSVHSVCFEQFTSTYVILPQEYNGKLVHDIVASNGFSVTPYIETLDIHMIDPTHLQMNSLILIDVKL